MGLKGSRKIPDFLKTSPGKLCVTFDFTPSDCLKVDLGPLQIVLSKMQILLESTLVL